MGCVSHQVSEAGQTGILVLSDLSVTHWSLLSFDLCVSSQHGMMLSSIDSVSDLLPRKTLPTLWSQHVDGYTHSYFTDGE